MSETRSSGRFEGTIAVAAAIAATTAASLCFSAVATGQQAGADATATINTLLKPRLVKVPGFPFRDKELARTKVATRLKKLDEARNGITDGDEWYTKNTLPRPPLNLAEEAMFVPGETRWGKLKFFRSNGSTLFVGVYEAVEPRPSDPVYDKQFSYRAVVFDADYRPTSLLILDEVFPDILEMSTVEVVGDMLYFDCNYNGYASLTKGKTGYLVALDLATGKVAWASKALTASAWNFVVHGEVIFSGYGFTDEKDFLYVLSRHDGTVLQREKLASAHHAMVVRGNRLYVRCYDTDYVFEIKE